MKATERLWLTADRKRLVADGHKDAATLYAAPGDEIPQSAADMFGLKDGRIAARRPSPSPRPHPEEPRRGVSKERGEGRGEGPKQARPVEDKQARPAEDKSGAHQTVKGADDLSRIPGIGVARRAALAAAGIVSFARLAAIDPAAPPDVPGVTGAVDWPAWIAQAAAMAERTGDWSGPAATDKE